MWNNTLGKFTKNGYDVSIYMENGSIKTSGGRFNPLYMLGLIAGDAAMKSNTSIIYWLGWSLFSSISAVLKQDIT